MQTVQRVLWLLLTVCGSFPLLGSITDRHVSLQIEALSEVEPESIRFVVLPDRTGGEREAVFQEAVAAIRLLNPDFVVTVGDHVEGYTKDSGELKRQWSTYLADIEMLDCPVLMTPGNHDNLLSIQKDLWGEILGTHYYHYRIGDFLFLHLDSQDNSTGGHYQTGISPGQLRYMEAALQENTDAEWTFVIVHQPIWSVLEDARLLQSGGSVPSGRHQVSDLVDNGNWNKLEALLQKRRHTVFAGHEHQYRYEKRNGYDYFTLATAGGISPLNGLADGTFDHLTLVSAAPGKDPVISTILLEGILPAEVVSAEDGAQLGTLHELIPEPVIKPVLVDPDKGAATVVAVGLSNPSQHPLQYEVTCVNQGGVRLGKSRYTGTLSASEDGQVEVPVWHAKGDPLPSDAGLRVQVSYRIPLDGKACYEKTVIRDAVFRAPAPGTILGLDAQAEHGPEYLMDADLTTYWTYHGQNARFVYALPEAQKVRAIKLAFYKGDKRQAFFEIRGSNNLTDWETLLTGTSSGKTAGLEEFRFLQPTTVRYLEFVGHGNSQNEWNSVLEMELQR